MGIQQLLLGGGPNFLTPEEALQFFYDNTTLLIALDVNNVQSWVPRGRFNVSNDGNTGGWSSKANQLFDFTVGSLTGKAANSNFTTVLPIAYGNDDYADEPNGRIKTFTDLQVTITGAGIVTTPPIDNPGAVISDFGGGIGTFEVPESIKNFDSLTLDINHGSTDDYGIYHTALLPGRWKWLSTVSSPTSIIAGNGPFPSASITQHAEYSVVVPPFSFLVYYHATNQAYYSQPPSDVYLHQYATIPTGCYVAYERRPLYDNRQYVDFMVVNLSSTNKTVVVRVPWEASYSFEGESGTVYVNTVGYRFGAIHVFGPREYFDVPDALGQAVSSGFLVAAENISAGNVSITFTPSGAVSKFYEASDSTTNVWASPSNPLNGSYYFIRFQQTSSTDGATTIVTGGALNTWIPLTSNVSVSRSMPSSGVEQTFGTVEISTTASTVGLVSTGTYRLDAAYYSVGGGVGGGGSVSVNAFLPSGVKVNEVAEGDELLLLASDYVSTTPGKVISSRRSTQRLVTMVSESGIHLTVSDNTPLTLSNGIPIFSTDAVGMELPVQDENGFRWEKIVSVTPAGEGEVETIFCENQCYAAGDVPGRYIWTHNAANNKN